VFGPDDIRKNLRLWVQAHMKPNPTDVLIDELGFSNSTAAKAPDKTFRADLALANGRLVGFEIKSGNDSLRRWPTQCEAYFRVFDEIWLCTHGNHLEKALPITPSEAGIIIADDFGGMAVLRKASTHKRVSVYDLTGFLWREELEALCQRHDLTFKKRDTKPVLREIVSSSIPAGAVREFVLRCIKLRKSD
jgi:hypothetical protein